MIVRKKSMNTVDTNRGVTSFFGRVGAESTHGVDLFRHYHGSQFAGHAGSIAPGHHEPGNDRPQLCHHSHRNQLPDERQRSEPLQGVCAVQRKGTTDGKSGEHDNGQRTNADQIGLLQHVAPIHRMLEQVGNRTAHQQRVFLDSQDFFLGKLRWRDEVDTTEEVSGSHACILRRY